MSNSDLLLEAIFTKCGLVYGRDFLSRWEGLDLAEVKADWRRELGHWLTRPESIGYALERLPPDRPPNVLQFRSLCQGGPLPQPEPVLMIDQTEAQKEAAAEIKRKAVAALKLMGSRKPRGAAA